MIQTRFRHFQRPWQDRVEIFEDGPSAATVVGFKAEGRHVSSHIHFIRCFSYTEALESRDPQSQLGTVLQLALKSVRSVKVCPLNSFLLAELRKESKADHNYFFSPEVRLSSRSKFFNDWLSCKSVLENSIRSYIYKIISDMLLYNLSYSTYI